MMSTRKTAVLALTLATGPLMIANTAHAAPSCGTPAVEAVYTTVHHDAENVVVGQQKVIDQPAQPAVPAVYATESYVITPAVPAVPAVTDTETQWTVGNSTGPDGDGWTPTGEVKEHAAVTQTQYQWEKVTTTTDYEWMLKVVDQPATSTVVHHDAVYRTDTVPATYKTVTVPATYKTITVPATYKQVVDVPEHTVHHDAVYDMTLYAYQNKQGTIRYETFGWNTADGHDKGWTLVTPYVHPVITPAWDEVVAATYKTVIDVPEHTESVVDVPAHDETVVDVPEHTVQVLVTAAWDETVTTPEVSHYEKQWTSSATEAPGDGWFRSDAAPRVTTQTDTVYTVDDQAAPEGYTLVGQETSVLKPAFTEYEWVRTVVVTPAQPEIPAVMGERQVLVTPEIPATDEVSHMEDIVVTIPAYDSQELVTPAVPAGEPCPVTGGGETGGGESSGGGEVINAGGEEIAGPGGSGAVKTETAAKATTSAASSVPTLAFTGFDPELYVAGGLALLFVGSGLTVVARRREN
ncbi:hypothetical protein GCM10025782_19660 [Pedococcus ginsenosidimutans]|uniref:Gram-positive cocci surface proteins LPxTG domain-containing protein n=1 Tax=Pedococcus ginsenosidimutans TaxID=490570 RepID=A0ABP8Y7N2_9MICO